MKQSDILIATKPVVEAFEKLGVSYYSERICGKVGEREMNRYSGRNFDDFLAEEGILAEVSAKALKRLLVLQIADIMEETNVTKIALAQKLRPNTSS